MTAQAPSLWLEQAGPLDPRPALPGDVSADVAIAGAGYTGLWTAYYLKKADPSLNVVVCEKTVAGFGASGRNGGWCSALFAASKEKVARRYGRDAAVAMQQAMIETVDEVGRVCDAEGIDAGFHKGGTLAFATSPAHVARLQEEAENEAAWGFGDEAAWLSAGDAAARLRVAGSLGALYTPHCARVHPARLVRGLADVVERLGVRIYEDTEVTEIAGGALSTRRGTVHAPVVVRALEGYTSALKDHRRTLMPIYSLMIATEPLSASFFEDVGWHGRETVTDGRHLLIYAQRTPDDRIAFGGRGAPYHFGSRIDPAFDRDGSVFAELTRVLHELWPGTRDAQVTHRWGGPLGVPRDWFSSVGFDPTTGLAWAGGYVGDGVSTTNLAGRILADLIGGRDSELLGLPWVNHRSRAWEPEPLRWLGTNLSLKAMASADSAEARSGRPARRADVIRRLTAH